MNKPLKPFKEVINGIKCNFSDHGGYYRLEFTPAGCPRERRSTGTDNPTAARAFANQATQDFVPGVSSLKKVSVGELVEMMLAAKRNDSERDYVDCLRSWNLRLRDKFAGLDHRELTTDMLEQYKSWCLGLPQRRWEHITKTITRIVDDASHKNATREVALDVISKATINRDLHIISHAYQYGRNTRKITLTLKIPRYGKKQLGARTGEVTIEEFHKVMAICVAEGQPLWLLGILQVSWDAGHRAGEPRKLLVRQFDGEGFVLDPGHDSDGATEKNGNGRWVPLSDEGIALVKQLCMGKGPEEHIFTRDDRNSGERAVRTWRKKYRNLMMRAIGRVPLMHDFRRSAVTNLAEAGVDEKLRQGIVGHDDAVTNRKYRQGGRERLKAAMRQKVAWERQQLSGGPSEADQLAAMQKQLDQANAQNAALLAAMEKLTAAMTQTAVTVPVVGQQRNAEVN